jgi:hypothetical protein
MNATGKPKEKNTMKALNKQSSKVFLHLIEGLKEPGNGKKVNNAEDIFMPVHIDYLWQNEHGRHYALAHYYTQNGDMMSDPEMIFLVTGESIIPMSFRQDGLGIHQIALIAESGEAMRINIRLQGDLARFANQWMQNIKEQQGL